MKVIDVIRATKCNIRIEKHDDKDRMCDFDYCNYHNYEVKEIKPYSDGGEKMILIII